MNDLKVNSMLLMVRCNKHKFPILIILLSNIAQHVEFSRETDLIERTLHEIEHRISITGKAEIIDKQKDLLNSIKMIYQKPMRNFFHTPISCNFPR
jgi:hypothetical protein